MNDSVRAQKHTKFWKSPF